MDNKYNYKIINNKYYRSKGNISTSKIIEVYDKKKKQWKPCLKPGE